MATSKSKNKKFKSLIGKFSTLSSKGRALAAVLIIAVIGATTLYVSHAASLRLYVDPNPYASACGVTNGVPATSVQPGSTGSCVSYLQWDLNQYFGLGHLTINGVYDAPTKQAVLAFKSAFGLSADQGLVGHKVWVKLKSVECYISSDISADSCTYVSQSVSQPVSQ